MEIPYYPRMDDVRERLQFLMQKQGLNPASVSKALGLNHAYIQQFLRRGSPRVLPETVRIRLAHLLGVDQSELGSPALDVPSLAPPSPATAGTFRPPPELVSHDEPLPVYAAAEGGQGTMILSSEPIDQSPRPYMLRGVRDAYGILITGESMVPAFRPGDVAWVDPRLPPIRGTEAIFYAINDENGEARASIKELVSWTDTTWTVQQWNPAKTFKLPRPEWGKCHRVVGRLLRR